MLGTSGDVKAMDGSLGSNNEYSTRVTCVADFYGPTNFLTMNATAIESATLDHDAAESPESLLIGSTIQENLDKVATANPITYISTDAPPFLSRMVPRILWSHSISLNCFMPHWRKKESIKP